MVTKQLTFIPSLLSCCFCFIKATIWHVLLILSITHIDPASIIVRDIYVSYKTSRGDNVGIKSKNPTYLNPQIVVVLEHFAI